MMTDWETKELQLTLEQQGGERADPHSQKILITLQLAFCIHRCNQLRIV